MKRLKLVQAMPRRDTAHRAHLRSEMRIQLRDEARAQGLKAGPITFDEYFQELDLESGGGTLYIIEARCDAQ